jgi:Zn-finger domain-containing protein
MFKIFNHKYYKALKEIDEEIKELIAKENKMLNKISECLTFDEYKTCLAWADIYRHRREGLEILRGNLTNYIG